MCSVSNVIYILMISRYIVSFENHHISHLLTTLLLADFQPFLIALFISVDSWMEFPLFILFPLMELSHINMELFLL